MPHGYQCDRCGDFIEQRRDFHEAHSELGGDGLETVRIDNPVMQSDSGGDIEVYTLCEPCRSDVIDDIESVHD